MPVPGQRWKRRRSVSGRTSCAEEQKSHIRTPLPLATWAVLFPRAEYTGLLTACPTLRVTSGEYAVHWGERFGNLLNCGTKVRYSVSACPVLPKNRSPPALRV